MTLPNSRVVTDVEGWSVTDVDRLIEAIHTVYRGRNANGSDSVENTGWTKALVDRAFDLLTAAQAHLQIRIIKNIIDNGGIIDRDGVYELGHRSVDRSLRGVTRPTNRATQQLRDRGELPEDAEELLEPIWDRNVIGYHRARGLRIPLEIVALYTTGPAA